MTVLFTRLKIILLNLKERERERDIKETINYINIKKNVKVIY